MVDVAGDGGLWGEVVKLSAVDFLSGGTLLDTLVLPTAKVRRWKTEITGITNQTLSEARAQGRTLKGWTEARSELWRYIDADTVLVGQALHHDLDVLGMLHARIVDSAILAAKAIDHPSAKTVGLKKMCKEMLNVDVQCVSSGIHDCLEDVLASRELVLYSIHSPEKVQTWALSKRREELGKAVRLQRQRKDRRSTASSQRMANDLFDDDDEEDDEILRWEDIAEDLGWPHPDTGYDPWSD
jgi:DNA polymerase III epsilon subunit-like protein